MWKLSLGWVGHLDLIYVLVKGEIVGPQGINIQCGLPAGQISKHYAAGNVSCKPGDNANRVTYCSWEKMGDRSRSRCRWWGVHRIHHHGTDVIG